MEIELEAIHLTVLLVTAVFILIADHDGFKYVRGTVPTLNLVRVQRLHYAVLVGLILMIATGGLMVTEEWERFSNEPAFLVKMIMVGALVANSFVIGTLMHLATQKPFASLMPSEKYKLFASGGVSVLCWIGAASIGLFLL